MFVPVLDPTVSSTATRPGKISSPTFDELAARFRPIFARIAEGAVLREQSRELAFEAIGWLRDAGFGALRVPRSFGGLGATLPQLFRLLVELGEADSNLPQILRAHFAFIEGRLLSPDRSAHEFWFPKIADGALVGAAMSERTETTDNTTTLTEENGRWFLNGEKYYCTGTIYADWIAAAAVDGVERVSVALPATAAGVMRIDDWDGFGQRLTGSGTTRFQRVEIDPANIVRRFLEFGPDFDSYIKTFYQLVLLSALAGIGRAVVRDSLAFVRGRTRAFGVPGKSSPRSDPLVQRVIGRLSSLSFAADAMVDAVAVALEDAQQTRLTHVVDPAVSVGVEIKAFQAQQVVINLILEATTLLFEVGGASATSESRRLDRHWRNARTIASHNPAIFRERAIGDYLLNGTLPDAAWREILAQRNPSANSAISTPSVEHHANGVGEPHELPAAM